MFTCQTRPSIPPACPGAGATWSRAIRVVRALSADGTSTAGYRWAWNAACAIPHWPPARNVPRRISVSPAADACCPATDRSASAWGPPGCAGESCTPFDQCEPGTVCLGGTCTEPPGVTPMPPTAPLPPANLGDDCSRVSCDARQDGIYCNRITSKCEAMLPLAMPGQPCGPLLDGSGGTVFCTAGATCVGRQGLTRTCEPDLPVGEACQATLGARCARPATCVSGRCQEPSVCE